MGFGPQTDEHSVTANPERESLDASSNERSSQDIEENGEDMSTTTLLQFSLDASILEGAVSEYSAICTHSPLQQLNYETYLMEIIGPSLVNHIQERIETLGYGLRCYWTLNCEFWRTVAEEAGGGTQSILAPFRQTTVTYSINDREYISTRVAEGVQTAIEKVAYFLQSGYVIRDVLYIL